MKGLLTRFAQLRQHRVSRNASWIFLGQGMNFLLQAGYFVLLARLLGVKEYGLFAGAFAVVNLVTPYSALGAGMLFMRYVTLDRSNARVYWGNSLVITAAATVLIAGALFLAGPALTKTHNSLIFVVLVAANCFCAQIANLGSLVFQTFEKMRWTAMLGLVANLARLLILIVMRFTLHHATAFQWSIGVLVASGCAAALSVAWVRAEIGPATFEWNLVVKRAGEGLGFSFAGTTQAAYNDVDKVMLAHYGLSRENGFYSLAYRVIDVATTPIMAMDSAVLPRFFALGQKRMTEVVRLAAKTAGVSVLLGAGIGVGVLLLAPLIPHLVGRDFSGVLIALRWLCWIPLLRGIHRTTGSALTGTGRQNLRTTTQLTVAALNLGLNLWWIPVYGWIGAAWSSVASDGLLALLNSGMLLWALWTSTRSGQQEAVVLSERKAFS
jgi:O-antigen/teichoic acid export membrane protein